jgi:phosphogluconate dehydratase
VLIDATEWAAREPARMPQAQRSANSMGIGRELFSGMRHNVTSAEEGACSWL